VLDKIKSANEAIEINSSRLVAEKLSFRTQAKSFSPDIGGALFSYLEAAGMFH